MATCAALALVGCATYDDDHYRGAPPDERDVIYDRDVGELRSPGGLDLPRGTDSPRAIPPAMTPPSGNRLRSPEPAPRYPTEAVPPTYP